MTPKGCIIYCIEKGILEKYTILSISSIKNFGGFLAQYDIYCFQPRKEFPISNSTKKILSDLGAKFMDTPLNINHRYYAIANKSIVCDYMARKHNYNQYIFLDSDTIILNEPNFFVHATYDISLSPVYSKGIGMLGGKDENFTYWQKLFEITEADMENLPTVKTIFEGEEIFGYWNAGVIVINGQSAIFKKWNNLVIYSLEKKIYPANGLYFIDQTCLAAILLSENYVIEALPVNYNFPLADQMLDRIDESGFDEIVILHHLSDLQVLKKYEPVLKENYKYQWIQEKLLELSIKPSSKKFNMARKIEQIEKGIKERLYYFIYKFTNKYFV